MLKLVVEGAQVHHSVVGCVIIIIIIIIIIVIIIITIFIVIIIIIGCVFAISVVGG